VSTWKSSHGRRQEDHNCWRMRGITAFAACQPEVIAAAVLDAQSDLAPRAGPAATSTGVAVSTSNVAQFGKILMSGNTVYTLEASKTCRAAQCLKIWPEHLLPKGAREATATGGVSAPRLGTIERSGGALQVTYDGKPPYTFVEGSEPGQVGGSVADQRGSRQ
jgi:predicted lipoprotein with Yx(FWY)xxD motif